ncbi:MAG: tripartite tricarboxylate transporter substrate binding protein [Pseudomonadota bacterium]
MIARRCVLACFLASGLGCAALAQSYPERLIKFIVPFAPGGPVDIVARLITPQLPSLLGQSVIVENRPGAASALGTKAAANAEPDGYTLMFGNITSLVVLPIVTNNRDYDPVKMFTPVAKTSQNYEVLIVHPSFPARTLPEFIAYARANPGKLNFSSAGLGNTTHLAAELFKLRTGIDIVHVPYKGAAEAAMGVVAEQVHMFFGDVGGVMPLIREGRVRALAISSEARSPDLPDVPTMTEGGVRDYVVMTYTGVVAPAATSPAIVAKVNAAINTSLRTPNVVAAMAKIGIDSRPSSPEEFGTFLTREREKWSEVVRRSGVKID